MRCILLLAIVVAMAAGTEYWAWVDATGKVQNTDSGATALNVTRIDTGVYCVNKNGNPIGAFNYAAILVTPETDGTMGGNPALTTSNSGWGSKCNPYGGSEVRIYDIKGAAIDRAFSVLVRTRY
jgi:hypothetical protein